jgi:hypothetical protein
LIDFTDLRTSAVPWSRPRSGHPFEPMRAVLSHSAGKARTMLMAALFAGASLMRK